MMDYTLEEGWHNQRIVPYGPIMMEPSHMVLHYGQETFEGMKAYKNDEGEVFLFRPEMNARRLNASNRRLCIPEIPEEVILSGIETLVALEERWIPAAPGTSLYIRPFVFATEPSLSVHPSRRYTYMVILSPVGAYYKEGINPVKIHVETEYVRAAVGGVGFAKTGGNYGASLLAQEEAKKRGYTQVLWLDSKEHRYVEEVGTMNVFFLMDDVLVTPKLSGSILPGVTRDSVINIAKSLGVTVEERALTIDEVVEGIRCNKLEEAFGTGTAAVISPVGELNYKGETLRINNGVIGDLSGKLYELITGIQTGRIDDEYGYRYPVSLQS